MKNSSTNVKRFQKPSRVVAFGDSITYGQGLRDCFVPWTDTEQSRPGKECSKLAYPQLLGDILDVPVVNNGIPGGSNRQILHALYTFDFKPDDLVIVGWSFFGRDFYFSDTPYKDIMLGPWSSKEKLISTGFLNRGTLEMLSRNCETVLAGYHYLRSLTIKPICFSVDCHNFSTSWFEHLRPTTKNEGGNLIVNKQLDFIDEVFNYQKEYNYCYHLSRKHNDWALDAADPHMREGHPGERTHKALVSHIVNTPEFKDII
jgi:hypothetical protein